jgi:cell division protein FtsI/penicillin-binding protein 2
MLSGLAIFGINANIIDPKSLAAELGATELPVLTERDHRRIIDQYLSLPLQKNTFVPSVDIDFLGAQEKVRVLYTFDFELQREIELLLQQYASDYASVVAMDPTTGRILAMASYEGGHAAKENWALKASFPAASIFKIVTASAAIEKYNVSPEMELGFTGGNYKLYKRDLFNDNRKWARWISFKEAFAKSINIFFGKLALKFMHADDLMAYANKFYFNKDLAGDMPAESGKASLNSLEPFHVAEVASGFNSLNTLSPIHGAMIASAIVNDGALQSPYMVESLLRGNGSSIYKAGPYAHENPITNVTAQKLRDLMNETIEHGTSRKSFKELTRAKKYSLVEAGGKTGSLNGNNPKGKTDWFVGYARLGSRMMAISVVTVNKNYWKVKSSYIAQRMIKKYFKEDVILSTASAATTDSAKLPIRISDN